MTWTIPKRIGSRGWKGKLKGFHYILYFEHTFYYFRNIRECYVVLLNYDATPYGRSVRCCV